MPYTQLMSYVAKNLDLTQTWNNAIHLAEQFNGNIPDSVKEAVEASNVLIPSRVVKLTSDYVFNGNSPTSAQQTLALSVAGIATLGIVAYNAYNYCKNDKVTKKEIARSPEELELLGNFDQLLRSIDNIYNPDIDTRLDKADKIKTLCEEAFEIHAKDRNNSIDFKSKVEEIRTLVNDTIKNREPETQEKIKKESEALIASVTKCARLQGISKNKKSLKLLSPGIEISPPSPQGVRVHKHH